ncbi:ATP-dependent DNA helicase homolog RECG1, chloroplastic/mitochondrial isoform X1 [Apium graveolens]|uniref:ATP-dependent DNA helicase homolog RECG1, chloroplastic/mitochondrial isoform X1 n=2 Tax=Apium graveolens TaxID=4045 RepID=UPI003D7A9A1C
MALTVSVVQSCSVSFSEKCLRSAIIFEAERGYTNVLGRKMRFNNFLFSKVSKLCSRSKHKFAESLLKEVGSYERASITDRSKLLNKVSILMGYGDLNDLFENESASTISGMNKKDAAGDFNFARKRFPSIILGQSPKVKLYDENTYIPERIDLLAGQICKDFSPTAVSTMWANPDSFYEAWPSMASTHNLESPSSNNEDNYKLSASLDSQTVETNSVSGSSVTGEIWLSQAASLRVAKSSSSRDITSYTSPLQSNSQTLKVEPKLDPEPFIDDAGSGTTLENQQTTSSVDLFLDKPISFIPKLSKKQSSQLENCGLHTLRKLLHHFPRTYADLHDAQIGIEDGQYFSFVGKVLSSRGVRASFTLSFLEVVVGCEITEIDSTSEQYTDEIEYKRKKTVYLHLMKFFRGTRFTFQPFLKSLQAKHKEGEIVCVSGKVRSMHAKDHYEMREYNMDVIPDGNASCASGTERPYPIYPSKGGINPNILKNIISRVLPVLPGNIDPIPRNITEEFGLVPLRDAYLGIHQPENIDMADSARRRLIFDDFFYLQLGRLFQMLEGLGTQIEKDKLLDKYRKPEVNAVFAEDWCNLTKHFLRALPYSLTRSQLNAASEIIWDLKRQIPMYRLLQGDVGCGKTVVAFLACMEVIASGFQAAFMVPTELLAVQHYEHLLSLLEDMGDEHDKPSVALLTGSTPSKQSRLIREGLRAGDISLVIGTHSLIAEKVEFSALRIAVVDEQHRFGVIQRGRFNSKLYFNSLSSTLAGNDSSASPKAEYMAPHILAMSATPIPRTLALALYGDMSLTQITDLPPGRIPIETCIIEGNESGFSKVYQIMLDELKAGGKIYLVYPVIELSEQLPQLRAASADFETISSKFTDYNCGLLHGKMKSDEKDEALRRFRSGETHILLATQVIEIGVDVPDASMMVVMNAERFGMAQLHQLRGRVGRGVRKSKCILVASTISSLSRLKVLESSQDGFHLANMDLVLRGPGDLLGKKQSGHLPDFPIARLEIDGNILQDAHVAALRTLGMSHDLEKFPELKAELSMRQPLCILGD